MIGLTVEPEDGGASLFGKTVNELQENIRVSGDKITGMLKYVTHYTGFSSVSEDQAGHYLALKISDTPEGSSTTVEVVGGTKGPVTLDEDMNIVLRIQDKNTQKVKVVTTMDDDTNIKVFDLTGLTLEPAG